jgi:SCP1.201-like deaminase
MACLAQARERTIVCLAAAERSAVLLAAYLGFITGGGTSTPVSDERSARPGRVDLPAHVRHANVVRDVRARLGRGVRGSETRGAWLHADGSTEDVRSGLDTLWYRRAKAIFSGFGNLRYTRLARHCEGQAVVRMQKEQLREATIILDRAPCGTPPDPADAWTCDQKLDDIMRRLLPAGSVLTVIDPDGKLWMYPKEEQP